MHFVNLYLHNYLHQKFSAKSFMDLEQRGEKQFVFVCENFIRERRTEFWQVEPAIYSLIEHHDKRTLTVGGACESVQNQLSLRFKDTVDTCAWLIQRLSRAIFHIYAFTVRLTRVNREGASGTGSISRTERKHNRGGLRIWRFSQHGTSVSWSFNPFLSHSPPLWELRM